MVEHRGLSGGADPIRVKQVPVEETVRGEVRKERVEIDEDDVSYGGSRASRTGSPDDLTAGFCSAPRGSRRRRRRACGPLAFPPALPATTGARWFRAPRRAAKAAREASHSAPLQAGPRGRTAERACARR